MNPPDDAAAALLEAGRSLFARNGYDGASVRDITRSAGVNLGAVTYHFGTKRELYEAVLRHCGASLSDRVEAAAANSEEETARARINDVLEQILAHVSDRPDVPALLFQEVAAGRDVPPPVADSVREIAEVLAELIRRGKAEGSVDAGDPLLTASSLLSETMTSFLVLGTLTDGRTNGDHRGRRSTAGVRSHVLGFVDKALAPAL